MANFNTPYNVERDGQIEFFDNFGIPYDDDNSVLVDYTDGVYNGNILEFKKDIQNTNEVLFQAIKYLSKMRVHGESVPATIILVDLNSTLAYVFHSSDFRKEIHKIYTGASSKQNKGFFSNAIAEKLNYSIDAESAKLKKILKGTKKDPEEMYIPIDIDENCIVGWSERYYKELPNASKGDFIGDTNGTAVKLTGEIRKPRHFEGLITPYQGKSNERFKFLMDCLNDRLSKKELGAYYTPVIYARQAAEFVMAAIGRIPEGNDYIILDRSAGTGNLEASLIGLKDAKGDDIIRHCVVSTYEYYEYKVLQEILGSKVRHIIPPVEANDTFNAGLVRGADALTKEYIKNPIINQYIDDPNCTIILFENPPYAETTSMEHQRKGVGKKSSTWKNSFVVGEMKKHIKGSATNDLGNAFIWSGFEYFLRQPTDSFIVYSPVKYWKIQHLIDKKLLKGYAFNRKWFHTNIDACIMCALWANENDDIAEFEIDGYDFDKNSEQLIGVGMLPVKRVFSMYSGTYYDKRTFDDDTDDGILLQHNGYPVTSQKQRIKPIYNSNMLGYMVVDSPGFDNPDLHSVLLRAGIYNGNGFFLRKDNYLEKMTLFAASRYITYNREWTERSRIMKSGDGAYRFNTDVASGKLDQWLRKCLLFTCLETQNHMRSFNGSDGRFYRNELCLDTTNGETVASKDLMKLDLNDAEKALIAQWDLLLSEIKKTKEYKSSLTYGVYQIFDEIDTSYKDEDGNTIWNNIEVHSALKTLKTMVKNYYNNEIVPKLFDYEFLK